MTKLTKRRREVLAAIQTFIAKRGFSPTNREIAGIFGWKSPNAALGHLRILKEHGYIDWQPGVARTIQVLRIPEPSENNKPQGDPPKPTGSTPKPGIYEDVPFEEYLAWDAVSNSRISLAIRSLAHYQAGFSKEPTKALHFGSLIHCGQLEPLAFAARYAVMPAFEQDAENVTAKGVSTKSKATSYYKAKSSEFTEVNRGKEIVTQTEYIEAVGLVRAIAAHERASEYLGGAGPVEASLVWEDHTTGLPCKARIDKWQREKQRFCDLKTTRDALKFNRAIVDYGYHRQAAFYQQGIHTLLPDVRQYHQPYIVAVESVAPWGVRAAPLHEEWLMIGRTEVSRALNRIAEATACGVWPGYDSPEAWLPPSWYTAKEADDPIELTVGGKKVAI